jgi:hypothetical protein
MAGITEKEQDLSRMKYSKGRGLPGEGSFCVERDKTASEDETGATRHKAKLWAELEEKR